MDLLHPDAAGPRKRALLHGQDARAVDAAAPADRPAGAAGQPAIVTQAAIVTQPAGVAQPAVAPVVSPALPVPPAAVAPDAYAVARADAPAGGEAPPPPSLSEDAALIALSLPVGVVVVDAQGRIVMVNQRLCDMFGYPGADLRGKSLEVLLPERYRQGHNALRAAYHAAPVARMMGRGRDLTGLRADGMEFPIEIGLGALPTSRGQLVLATVVDITERKRTELQLREANAQLEEFTSVASHDLRSPLRGVSNLIDFILDDYGDTAPVGVLRNLDRVKDRIGRMEQLIEDLLAYARAGRRSAKLELIDLEDIVEEMVRLDPPPEGFRLETDLDVAPFLGSATPLRTVIRNLYTNAFKHHDLKGGVIRIAARGEGDACVIEIGDDGPGIPVLVQERVFRLFQTLAGDTAPSGTPRLGGSGLGLAVAKRLVEGHGGRIEVNSPDGVRGATFRIHWPRYMRTDLDD